MGLDALCTIIPIIRALSEKLSDNPRKDTGDAMHVHPLDSAYTEIVHRRVTHKDVCSSRCFSFNNPTLRYQMMMPKPPSKPKRSPQVNLDDDDEGNFTNGRGPYSAQACTICRRKYAQDWFTCASQKKLTLIVGRQSATVRDLYAAIVSSQAGKQRYEKPLQHFPR